MMLRMVGTISLMYWRPDPRLGLWRPFYPIVIAMMAGSRRPGPRGDERRDTLGDDRIRCDGSPPGALGRSEHAEGLPPVPMRAKAMRLAGRPTPSDRAKGSGRNPYLDTKPP